MSVDFSSGLTLGWILKYDEWKNIPRDVMDYLMEEDYIIFLDGYDTHCDMVLNFCNIENCRDAGSAMIISRPDIINRNYEELPGYAVSRKVLELYISDKFEETPEWMIYSRIS